MTIPHESKETEGKGATHKALSSLSASAVEGGDDSIQHARAIRRCHRHPHTSRRHTEGRWVDPGEDAWLPAAEDRSPRLPGAPD